MHANNQQHLIRLRWAMDDETKACAHTHVGTHTPAGVKMAPYSSLPLTSQQSRVQPPCGSAEVSAAESEHFHDINHILHLSIRIKESLMNKKNTPLATMVLIVHA
jgi:hypothetical protein